MIERTNMGRFRIQPEDRPGRWLCIAYAFPPIHRSGTHRTLGFIRHLDDLGWDATVLTVNPPNGERVDGELAALVPETTRVVRTDWYDAIAIVKRMVPGMAERTPTDPQNGTPAYVAPSRRPASAV